MLAGFGALLIVIGLIGTVPIHNVLYLFIAGLFLLIRDGLKHQQVSNVLLALSILSVVVCLTLTWANSCLYRLDLPEDS